MNKDSLHNDLSFRLTPEIMADYAQGNLSNEDQHFIERYLLDHPFEAAAMEGLALHPETFIADLDKIKTPRRSTRILPLWQQPIRMAAAVAILLLGSFFIFYGPEWSDSNLAVLESEELKENTSTLKDEQKKGNKQGIIPEKNKITPPETSEKVNKATAVTIEKQEAQASKTAQQTTQSARSKPIQEIQTERQAKKETIEQPIILEEEITEPIIVTEMIQEDDPATIESTELKEVTATSIERMNMEESFIAGDITTDVATQTPKLADEISNSLSGKVAGVNISRKSKKASQNSAIQRFEFNSKTIKGRITSADDGESIAGATIMIDGTTIGTTTDIDGNFELVQNSAHNLLSISFIGYVTSVIEVSDNDHLDVALEEDIQALSEVVVTAYGQASLTPINVSAQPENGYGGLKRFIKSEIRYPQEAKDKDITGKVTLSFTVNKSGSLSDFIIEKGLGYGCDEEAIRLIKDGPQWSPAVKNSLKTEERVTIKIKFKN